MCMCIESSFDCKNQVSCMFCFWKGEWPQIFSIVLELCNVQWVCIQIQSPSRRAARLHGHWLSTVCWSNVAVCCLLGLCIYCWCASVIEDSYVVCLPEQGTCTFNTTFQMTNIRSIFILKTKLSSSYLNRFCIWMPGPQWSLLFPHFKGDIARPTSYVKSLIPVYHWRKPQNCNP
jgi:hypothetical protein